MNIEAVAKNVAAENKKVDYDPTTGTNWSHLPTELRMECTKHLDFKTSNQLRATSTTEKALIDAKKIRILGIDLKYHWTLSGNNTLNISVRDEKESHQMTSILYHEKTFKLLKRVLKAGEVDTFNIQTDMRRATGIGELLCGLYELKPIRTRALHVSYSFFSNVGEILELFENVEVVSISINRNPRPKGFRLASLLNIPSIANANHLCIYCRCQPDNVNKLIDNWIKTDKPVGKLFQFQKIEDDILMFNGQEVQDKFSRRIVHSDSDKIRLRTNNPSKHILLDKNDCGQLIEFRGGVVPADFPEEEENEWLQKIEYP